MDCRMTSWAPSFPSADEARSSTTSLPSVVDTAARARWRRGRRARARATVRRGADGAVPTTTDAHTTRRRTATPQGGIHQGGAAAMPMHQGGGAGLGSTCSPRALASQRSRPRTMRGRRTRDRCRTRGAAHSDARLQTARSSMVKLRHGKRSISGTALPPLPPLAHSSPVRRGGE